MEHQRIKKKCIRSTNAQIKLLLNYMAANKTFANGRLFGRLEIVQEKQWHSLRVLLRKHGPDKSVRQWKTTWRDLKRKMVKQKLDAKKMADTVNVNKEYYKPTMSNAATDELHKTIEHETANEHTDSDPLVETFNGSSMQSGVTLEEELPTNSPGFSSNNVIQMKTETFTSPSADFAQTSSPSTCELLTSNMSYTSCTQNSSFPLSISTNTYLKPPCVNNLSHQFSISEHSTNPRPICAHTSTPYVCDNTPLPTATSDHVEPCHQNILPDVSPGNDNLQTQNELLQNLSNILEERNSILRIRNRIERNKMRFQHCRRF